MMFVLSAAWTLGTARVSTGSFSRRVVTSTRNQWSFSVIRSAGTIVFEVQSKGPSSRGAGGGLRATPWMDGVLWASGSVDEI